MNTTTARTETEGMSKAEKELQEILDEKETLEKELESYDMTNVNNIIASTAILRKIEALDILIEAFTEDLCPEEINEPEPEISEEYQELEVLNERKQQLEKALESFDMQDVNQIIASTSVLKELNSINDQIEKLTGTAAPNRSDEPDR